MAGTVTSSGGPTAADNAKTGPPPRREIKLSTFEQRKISALRNDIGKLQHSLLFYLGVIVEAAGEQVEQSWRLNDEGTAIVLQER